MARGQPARDDFGQYDVSADGQRFLVNTGGQALPVTLDVNGTTALRKPCSFTIDAGLASRRLHDRGTKADCSSSYASTCPLKKDATAACCGATLFRTRSISSSLMGVKPRAIAMFSAMNSRFGMPTTTVDTGSVSA